MLDTFGTKIIAAQAMKLFASKNKSMMSSPEHYLYLVAVSDAKDGAEQHVPDNIVNSASPELATILLERY